jgi:hypothetical protein
MTALLIFLAEYIAATSCIGGIFICLRLRVGQ